MNSLHLVAKPDLDWRKKKKRRERERREILNDGNNNGQATHGARMAHASRLAKILGKTNFHTQEFPRSGSKAKDGEKKKKKD